MRMMGSLRMRLMGDGMGLWRLRTWRGGGRGGGVGVMGCVGMGLVGDGMGLWGLRAWGGGWWRGLVWGWILERILGMGVRRKRRRARGRGIQVRGREVGGCRVAWGRW